MNFLHISLCVLLAVTCVECKSESNGKYSLQGTYQSLSKVDIAGVTLDCSPLVRTLRVQGRATVEATPGNSNVMWYTCTCCNVNSACA
jgi:hypothetical protein